MSNEEQKDECLYGKELKKNKNSDVRGSLKLEASTSKPIPAAGEEISLYVVIRNPFSVPTAFPRCLFRGENVSANSRFIE